MSAAVVRKKESKKKYTVRDTFKFQGTVCGSKEQLLCATLLGFSRYNSHLSFHCFPKDTCLRARWQHKIRRVEYLVTQHTKVCSRHFEDHEIINTATGRRVWQQALFLLYLSGTNTPVSPGPVFGSADLDHQVRNLTRRSQRRTASKPPWS